MDEREESREIGEIREGAEPGRRSLLVMLASFAALTALVIAGSLVAGALHLGGPQRQSSARGPAPVEPREAIDPAVASFLGPIAEGARFGAWRAARVHPGSRRITLDLEGEGGAARFTVDVLARAEGAPKGVAETQRLSIYVRTARGAITPAAAVEAAEALAAALRAREEAGHAPPSLDSLGAR